MSEDELAGQHHQCDEHDLGQIPGDVRDRETWCAASKKLQSQTCLSD